MAVKLGELHVRLGTLGDAEFLAQLPHPLLVEAREASPGRDAEALLVKAASGAGEVHIGRGPASDVRVVNLHVSTAHAVLVPPGAPDEPWRVVDKKSTNGTTLDGKPLAADAPVAVADGAVIGFGPDARYKFMLPSSLLAHLRRLTDDEATGERAGSGRAPAAAPAAAAQRPSESGVVPRELYLHCPPYNPLLLQRGKKLVAGRAADNAEVVLPDKGVSRRHAELEHRGDAGVFVRDLGSANGTFVAGTQLGTEPVRLTVGTRVSIGPFELWIDPRPTGAAIGGRTIRTAPGSGSSEGELRDAPLIDLLSEIEQRRRTGVLEVTGEGLRGLVFFDAGVPCDAWCGPAEKTAEGMRLEGVDAIGRLIRVKNGRFAIRQETALPPRRIQRTFSELLLEDFFDAAS